jgi:Rrf2 family iron-sulfur cluster assembly transcriptional regulator
MIFSHSCQYAIKSCIYLAKKREKVDVLEIATYINSPSHFTSKILQKLAKSNVISSVKGRNGGFYLNDVQYQSLTIKQVCSAFDGEKQFLGCILGLSECNEENPCPVHHIGVEIKEKFHCILELKINELKDIGNIQYLK